MDGKGIAVLAITKNGIRIGRRLQGAFGDWQLHVPEKFRDGDPATAWFGVPTSQKVGELFRSSGGVVCVFSLGAVVRLISPHLGDKKSDPAVVVVDDGANFAISVLSGHLGGANLLASEIASELGATPVVTTAADVNKTIAVDLVGREYGWVIDEDSAGAVTPTSACMVNGDVVGVCQDAGERNWWPGKLPPNVCVFDDAGVMMAGSDAKAFMIISDRVLGEDMKDARPAVVYRPPSLVVGVGLHRDTSRDTIRGGIRDVFERFGLSMASISGLASIKKPQDVEGLADLGREMGVLVGYFGREELAGVDAPNPSAVVGAFEGTSSVAEAAALLGAAAGGDGGCELVVEKQKFPPDLTVAVARRLH